MKCLGGVGRARFLHDPGLSVSGIAAGMDGVLVKAWSKPWAVVGSFYAHDSRWSGIWRVVAGLALRVS